MDLWDYAGLVCIWILGAVYGWYARERQAIRTINRLFSEENIHQSEETEEPRIHISVEKNNGVFYVYDKDNNTFMGQGKTRSELEDNLSKRFPNKRFMADKESLKVLNESL